MQKEEYINLETEFRNIVASYINRPNTYLMRMELTERLCLLFTHYGLEEELKIGIKTYIDVPQTVELVGCNAFSEYFLLKNLPEIINDNSVK